MSYLRVKYHAFPDYKIDLPIKWTVDPYKNKNWLHHFNSLRWMINERDLGKVEEVLRSFYNYHCVKKYRNPYYSEIRGDHTSAIRLEVFVFFKSAFKSIGSVSGEGIANRLIREEIKNIQRPEIYRSGHNHGLMLDLSLLNTAVEYSEFNNLIDFSLILNRSSKTVDNMWHENGVTKEHSISYQEYNLPLTVEYFEILQVLNIDSLSKVEPNVLMSETKRILGYALKDNGEYFPLGDSFRIPNHQILQKVFGRTEIGELTVNELLAPYSSQEGCYVNENFFIVRKKFRKRKIHFALTCCWDSHNHKKNDELSFCLDVDGISIFDAPGFCAYSTSSINNWLATEYASSTVFLPGVQYSDKKKTTTSFTSKIIKYDCSLLSCTATHSRMLGIKVQRDISIAEDKIKIRDEIITDHPQEWVVSRFILSKSIKAKIISNNKVEIEVNGKPLLELQAVSESNGFFKLGFSKIIDSDKTRVSNVMLFDYIRYGFDTVDFNLSFMDRIVKSDEKTYINPADYMKATPPIQVLWEQAQKHIKSKDIKMIKAYQNAIYKLHNSFVSPEMVLGRHVKFGYGGIGVVLHKDCIIGDGVTIAQNVTIGGSPGSQSVDENGNVFYVPILKNDVYVAAGSKVVGAVVIGKFSVIGANSVVIRNIEPFSICAGNPAKKIGNINKDNCLKYRSLFHRVLGLSKDEYTALFPSAN